MHITPHLIETAEDRADMKKKKREAQFDAIEINNFGMSEVHKQLLDGSDALARQDIA